jgi:hypothetical protein
MADETFVKRALFDELENVIYYNVYVFGKRGDRVASLFWKRRFLFHKPGMKWENI